MPKLKPRGVWEGDFLLDGCPVLQAIDKAGNCVRQVRLRDGIDERVARAWLEGYLERVDPVPQLRLVKPLPSAAEMRPGTFVRLLTARH